MPAPRIAVLTPDPATDVYAGSWPGVLGRLSAALAGTGAEITPTAWTDHVDDGTALAADEPVGRRVERATAAVGRELRGLHRLPLQVIFERETIRLLRRNRRGDEHGGGCKMPTMRDAHAGVVYPWSADVLLDLNRRAAYRPPSAVLSFV